MDSFMLIIIVYVIVVAIVFLWHRVFSVYAACDLRVPTAARQQATNDDAAACID